MEGRNSIRGRFKYADFEVTWTSEELSSGMFLDTVTRTYGHGVDYAETLTFQDPKAAEQKFLNWTMTLSCMTDEQASALFTSLMKEKDVERANLWNKAVMAAQVAQSAHRSYIEAKHDLTRKPSERHEAQKVYAEAQNLLLECLIELKIVRRPSAPAQ